MRRVASEWSGWSIAVVGSSRTSATTRSGIAWTAARLSVPRVVTS